MFLVGPPCCPCPHPQCSHSVQTPNASGARNGSCLPLAQATLNRTDAECGSRFTATEWFVPAVGTGNVEPCRCRVRLPLHRNGSRSDTRLRTKTIAPEPDLVVDDVFDACTEVEAEAETSGSELGM